MCGESGEFGENRSRDISKGSWPGKVHVADERKKSIIVVRQNLFNVLAKDASKPEDPGTMLTRWVVHKKGVRLEWKKPERSGLMRVPTRMQLVDGPTNSFTGALVIKCSNIWNRSTPCWGYDSLEAKQLTGIRTSERCEWILSRKIGGSEDITQESPRPRSITEYVFTV